MTISSFCFCQVDLLIAQTFKLIQGFTTMLREQRGEQLDEWLKQVDGQGVPELMSFSQGWDRATIDTKVSHLAELELVRILLSHPTCKNERD